MIMIQGWDGKSLVFKACKLYLMTTERDEVIGEGFTSERVR